jgi:glutamate-1-semialdehyde 2,1-aminomutase
MFKYFFRDSAPRNYREAKESDTAAFGEFWRGMGERGIFIPPSQFETNFLSVAHTDMDVDAIAGAYTACI